MQEGRNPDRDHLADDDDVRADPVASTPVEPPPDSRPTAPESDDPAERAPEPVVSEPVDGARSEADDPVPSDVSRETAADVSGGPEPASRPATRKRFGPGDRTTFEPPEKHKAADRAGKTLGHMAGSVNEALGAHDDPIVLNRKSRHVSIRDLEDLIDRALDENSS